MAKTFWNGQYRHTFTVSFEFISNKEDASDVSGAQKRRAMIRRSLELEGNGGTGIASAAFHRAFTKQSTVKVMLDSLEEGDE